MNTQINILQKIELQLEGIKSFCIKGSDYILEPGYRPTATEPKFQKWIEDTKVVIAEIFGEESDYYQRFIAIKYSSKLDKVSYGDSRDTFQRGIHETVDLLAEISHSVAFNKS